MTINKFQGKTKEEAIEKAKAEFGPNAVIMNVREVKPKGIFRTFRSSVYEVTAAVDERETYANAIASMAVSQKKAENINLSADEKIEIPKPVRTEEQPKSPLPPLTSYKSQKTGFSPAMEQLQGTQSLIPPQAMFQSQAVTQPQNFRSRQDDVNAAMQKKLENLTGLLNHKTESATAEKQQTAEEMNFVKVLYSTLLKNEVHERYANQIMDEVENYIRPGNSLDTILANVYQKLVLKFGQTRTIQMSEEKPNVIFFIGPTGVGKTTTIAKIASKYKMKSSNPKIAFITADTYRIAATEQLKVYANILDAPMSVVYTVDDLNQAVESYSDYDLIFVDTAGFSHKNTKQREDTRALLNGLNEKYQKEVYLVLSATTKYRDLLDIVDVYNEIFNYSLIFTKLDETSCYGNLLNIRLYANAELSYVTNGQNVPDDIEVFDTQKIVKQLLGGK